MGNTVCRRQRKRNLQERNNEMCGDIKKYVWLREERINLLIQKEWGREREVKRKLKLEIESGKERLVKERECEWRMVEEEKETW